MLASLHVVSGPGPPRFSLSLFLAFALEVILACLGDPFGPLGGLLGLLCFNHLNALPPVFWRGRALASQNCGVFSIVFDAMSCTKQTCPTQRIHGGMVPLYLFLFVCGTLAEFWGRLGLLLWCAGAVAGAILNQVGSSTRLAVVSCKSCSYLSMYVCVYQMPTDIQTHM